MDLRRHSNSNIQCTTILLHCCSRQMKYSTYSFYLCVVTLKVYTVHISLSTSPILWLHSAIKKLYIIWETFTSLNTIRHRTLCHRTSTKFVFFKVFFFSIWQISWKNANLYYSIVSQNCKIAFYLLSFTSNKTRFFLIRQKGIWQQQD